MLTISAIKISRYKINFEKEENKNTYITLIDRCKCWKDFQTTYWKQRLQRYQIISIFL